MKRNNHDTHARKCASDKSRVRATEEMVFKIIKKVQCRDPLRAFTKDKVFSEMKKKEIEITYRHLGRIFFLLRIRGRIVRETRGQYWLPRHLKRNPAYLKRQNRLQRKINERLETILESAHARSFELEEKVFVLQEHEAILDEEIAREEILRQETEELDQYVWKYKAQPVEMLQKNTKEEIQPQGSSDSHPANNDVNYESIRKYFTNGQK